MPQQPLTACEWDDGHGFGMEPRFRELIRNNVDFGSFHIYGTADQTRLVIDQMRKAYPQRPLMLTEYLARCLGSTINEILPLAHNQGVAAISWGLVQGKTNTIWPWWSWTYNMVEQEPNPWFHDLLRPNGDAYNPQETSLIRTLVLMDRNSPTNGKYLSSAAVLNIDVVNGAVHSGNASSGLQCMATQE